MLDGEIRPPEIHRKVEAEQLRHPDGHVGVAGEIEIDLDAEGNHGGPGGRHAGVF